MQIGWADWARFLWMRALRGPERAPTQVAQNDNFYVRFVIENHE